MKWRNMWKKRNQQKYIYKNRKEKKQCCRVEQWLNLRENNYQLAEGKGNNL